MGQRGNPNRSTMSTSWEEYAAQFERWKATLKGQRGEKPQALKWLTKKKDIPLDITHDEQGLDSTSIDGDDNTNVEETQKVPIQ